MQEALEYATPRRGPDGKFRAVEQLADEHQKPSPYPADFHPRGSAPPTPPSHAQVLRTSNEAKMLTPVERTNASVGQRLMSPHLQLVCGPLLKYDTIDKDGIYHGACLIVSKSVYYGHCVFLALNLRFYLAADASSAYDPPPFMILPY